MSAKDDQRPSTEPAVSSRARLDGPIHVFRAEDDPRAAAECADVVGQGFTSDPNNEFFCADPALFTERWRAIASNSLLRSPAAPMLHSIGAPPAAVAFAYSYPEHKVPDDQPEPPGIIDTSSTSRPETGPVLKELLEYLGAKKDEFYRAHGPFEYVAFLATRPELQGSGLGSRLLRYVTEKADASGRWCYLEATNPNNARLYERHGFRQLDTKVWTLESLPGKRAMLIPMARPPSARAHGGDGSRGDGRASGNQS